MYIAEFDEIHAMAENLLLNYDEDEIQEFIINYLTDAYIRGRKKTCSDLEWDWTDYYLLGWDEWYQEVILKEFEGKNVIDRIHEYVMAFDAFGLARLITTEEHRDFETGGSDQADTIQQESHRMVKKVWNTMMDERVRETHDYIEGVAVPVTSRFYTFDGDSAKFPGGFSNVANNVNCRCWLTYTW